MGLPRDFLVAIRTHVEDTAEVCTQETSQPIEVIRSVTWDDVRQATTSDPSMLKLLEFIEDGFPSLRSELPPDLRQFYQFRHGFTSFDGVALYNDRLVILRDRILHILHAAHQGISQMCSRAFFWPGMTPAIIAMREHCNSCNQMAPSQPTAPPTPPITPAYPFQCLVADYFHYRGHNYLVIVDRYSN